MKAGNEVSALDARRQGRRRSFSVAACVFCAVCVALLTGCRTTFSELSAPVTWQETGAAPVPVATTERTLPILTEDTPRCRWAASHLADVIERTCGRRPDVLVELEGQTNAWTEGLLIGNVFANREWDCPLSVESPEAFRVISGNGYIRFLGRADYAVFDWCERELGFRYYCPAGKCAERRSKIVARAIDYSDRPVFEHREIGGTSLAWVRASKAGSSHCGGVNVHAPYKWYLDKNLKATHPEIFETGETPMLCYGNPATLEIYKQRIDRHIRGLEDSGGIVNTNRKVVTVCQWDAPIRCTCSFCTKLYDPSRGPAGKASPIIWGYFLKELSAWLAVAHPDYMISFLPYLNTCEVPPLPPKPSKPPKLSKPFSNCEAEVCTMPGLALLKDSECKRNEERIIRDWHRVTGNKVLNWHYSCWPAEQTSAPYVFGRTVQAHYADMREKICGSYVCGAEDDPRLALSTYVWMRCLWNPDVDVGVIYDGFAQRMFGPGAKPMRELIDLQEECWSRTWDAHPPSLIPHPSFHDIFEISYPYADAKRMSDLLHEAYGLAAAAGDERAQDRIAWYASGFEVFFAESMALANRKGRRVIPPGATNEMIVARSVMYPTPWAKTTVTTARNGSDLVLRVQCFDPAANKMDFSRRDHDFVWGDDSVTFVFGGEKKTRSATVYLNGDIERDELAEDEFIAKVHPPTNYQLPTTNSWTVEAHLRLSSEELDAGHLLGNVCRWRVGDRRQAESSRVKGSRYEQSRLDTCFTTPNEDPAAFVEFRLK